MRAAEVGVAGRLAEAQAGGAGGGKGAAQQGPLSWTARSLGKGTALRAQADGSEKFSV